VAPDAPRWTAILARLRDPPGRLAAIVLGAVGLALAVWTFTRCFHFLIDYGRELYVPWRLAEGEVLYRDIAWFHGPLSAYVNAAAFAVFGASVRTLALVDLAIAAAMTVLVWHVGKALGGRLVALACGLAWLVVFAFQFLEWSGNFNWAAPYAHEATHGVALAMLALWCVRAAVHGEGRGRLPAALGGVCLGACFLTKAELFVAAALAVAALLFAWRAPPGARRRTAGIVAVAAAVPPLVAFALLWTAMPATDALRGVLGSWPYTFLPELRAMPYYRLTAGTWDVGESVFGAWSWTLTHVGTLLPGVLLAFCFGTNDRARRGARIALPVVLLALALGRDALLARRILASLLTVPALVAFGAAWALAWLPKAQTWSRVLPAVAAALAMLLVPWQEVVWEHMLRPLPLWLVACSLLPAAFALRSGRAGDPFPLAFTLLALLLLAKIALWTRAHHYGFALALPAGLAGVALLVGGLPRAVARAGGSGPVAAGTALGLLAVVLLGFHARCAFHLERNEHGPKTLPVGTGADRFLAHDNPITRLHVELLDEVIGERMAPGDSLAVVPEGVMLNFLTRRVNPTRFVNFMPPELVMFGEDAIVADFERRPPKWIVVVHRPSPEYSGPEGVAMFGSTFGQRLYRWILDHYRVFARAGHQPLVREHEHGVLVLEYAGKDGAPASGDRTPR